MKRIFYPVATREQIPMGTGLPVRIGDDEDIVIYHTEDDSYYASGRLCPHQNELMDLGRVEGCEVICRRHHLRFDLKTGDCTNAGGYAIRTLDVKIEADVIYIGVWDDSD